MVLLEFAMAPAGQGESLSKYVARVLDIVDRSGVSYRLTPMGTILEGDWDEVIGVVGACLRDLEADCSRVNITMRVDWRAGEASRLDSKVTKVEELLGRKLST